MSESSQIGTLIQMLSRHDRKLKNSFSLIPSENLLSPVARLAFLSDAYSRYFFDEKEVFGRWSFQGGSLAGEIQKEMLFPLLRKISKAEYVDVRAVSGLTGMTLALAALGGGAGATVFSMPVEMGGHPDTQYVAGKLGMKVTFLPGADWSAIDLDRLAAMVRREQPKLIYVDHATSLFPIDLKAMIETVRQASPGKVHIHVDSSHVNGLIWGGCYPNPLDCGADSYGGSTHKTFPGPHKAVLFTNDAEIFDRITMTAVNMISHHHLSEVIALAITLLEFVEEGGAAYATQTLSNARAFAEALHSLGFAVQAKDKGFTGNHQVWVDPSPFGDAYVCATSLFDVGFVVNPYNPLPSLAGPGIRMGVNEATRLGLKKDDMRFFAQCFRELLIEGRDAAELGRAVAERRARCRPAYCYGPSVFCESLRRLCAPFCADEGNLQPLVDFLYR